MASDGPRVTVSLGVESRILKPNFVSTYVTISRRASSNVRKRFEYQMFLQFFGHQCLKTRELDLNLQLVLQLFLITRHVRFSSLDPRLTFQMRATSRRHDRSQKVSFLSSCRRIIPCLQSSPCLQRVLPRVGDNVVRFTTRESHECCRHPLQHKLQVLNSSFRVRHSRQEFQLNMLHRDFRRLSCGPLQHDLRVLDHTPKERLRLPRPLLRILLFDRDLSRQPDWECLSELDLSRDC